LFLLQHVQQNPDLHHRVIIEMAMEMFHLETNTEHSSGSSKRDGERTSFLFVMDKDFFGRRSNFLNKFFGTMLQSISGSACPLLPS
jgi:hypothetical protein